MCIYLNFYSIAINIYRNPSPKIPFQTFEELQQLVKNNKLSVIASKTGAGAAIANSAFPKHAIFYEKNSVKAMERVNRENAKVHLGSLFAIAGTIRSFNCNLVMVSDGSFPQEYAGMLISKSAPKWFRNLPLPTIIAFRAMYKKYNEKYRPQLADNNCDGNSNKPLNVQQIASAFYLIASGLLAAISTFATELLLSKLKRRGLQYN